jgi:N-acetylglucosamine-6-phosphate deacetylase
MAAVAAGLTAVLLHQVQQVIKVGGVLVDQTVMVAKVAPAALVALDKKKHKICQQVVLI